MLEFLDAHPWVAVAFSGVLVPPLWTLWNRVNSIKDNHVQIGNLAEALGSLRVELGELRRATQGLRTDFSNKALSDAEDRHESEQEIHSRITKMDTRIGEGVSEIKERLGYIEGKVNGKNS